MYNHNKAQQSKNRVHILGYTVFFIDVYVLFGAKPLSKLMLEHRQLDP